MAALTDSSKFFFYLDDKCSKGTNKFKILCLSKTVLATFVLIGLYHKKIYIRKKRHKQAVLVVV